MKPAFPSLPLNSSGEKHRKCLLEQAIPTPTLLVDISGTRPFQDLDVCEENLASEKKQLRHT